MRANAPAAVGGLRFSELSLGHEPPRIMGVRPRTVMERGYLGKIIAGPKTNSSMKLQ